MDTVSKNSPGEKFQSRKFILGSAIIGITLLGIGTKRVNVGEGAKVITSTFGMYCASNVVQKMDINHK